jgi:hypothetical protein
MISAAVMVGEINATAWASSSLKLRQFALSVWVTMVAFR